MANEFLLVTQFLTAAALLGLAAWLLWLKWSSPVNRVFALFLVLRSLQILFSRFAGLADTPTMTDYWSVLAEYMFLLIPFTLLQFLVVYLRPRGERWMMSALLAGALAVLIAYLVDHCLSTCDLADGTPQLGPLALVSQGGPFTMGVVGAGIALALRFGPSTTRNTASALVAASFILNAVFDSLLAWMGLARLGWDAALAVFAPNVWAPLGWLHFGAAIVPATIGAAVLLVVYQRRGDLPNQGLVFVAALVVAVLSSAFVGLTGTSIAEEWLLFIVGLWRLIPLAFIAYALLRHRFIDLDLRVKFAVRSSTVAAFFAGAFFVGSEVIENFIDLPGPVLGIAAAAVIALALRPVQVLANRLADKAFPHTRPAMELSDAQRESLYREQAHLVWSDGRVGAKERVLLDRLQERLELSSKLAKELEREAAQAFQERARTA